MQIGELSPSNMAITITVEKDGFYEVNGTRHEPSVSLNMVVGATKLRRQLQDSTELIVCPGVYDGLSARIAMQLGFRALYMVSLNSHLI
jgi:methylisocitrate lyase